MTDYGVLEYCVQNNWNYIDLASERTYNDGIGNYDKAAKEAGVLAVTGASTFPGVTAAVVNEYLSRFTDLSSVEVNVNAGGKVSPGTLSH
jgi:saccharopine dehydrogenase-like NADP-dependent oxidoreductase